MDEKNDNLMDKITSLAKRRGFIYPGSELYGGLAGTYDYGPLGVALKNNIKNSWWKTFVENKENMYGIDAAILMDSAVWKASGHVGGFSDPMIECVNCNNRFRVDFLLGSKLNDYLGFVSVLNQNARLLIDDSQNSLDDAGNLIEYYKDNLNEDIHGEIKKLHSSVDVKHYIVNLIHEGVKSSINFEGKITQKYFLREIPCPNCSKKDWGEPRKFNMMFQTQIGAVQGSSTTAYLRPETAQGMFVNFKNIVDSIHPKLPFGLAQIGKAFRNEITPRDFIFRVREFEQMEIEYFIKSEDWEKSFEDFRISTLEWIKNIGINIDYIHELEVQKEDLAHYSSRTIDFEFDFPFGRKELYGLAYRTDFDLNSHNLTYQDEETNQKIVPHVIEPSFGLDRTVLALLVSAYNEEVDEKGETRVYLKLSNNVAPYKVCVSPLLKNKSELQEKARAVYKTLKKEFGWVIYDDNGNIGKRYRRQDEIGTPYCVVIDFDTLEKNMVSIRDRDTQNQEFVPISELVNYLQDKFK